MSTADELRSLARHLSPELAVEIERLYRVEADRDQLKAQHTDALREAYRLQVVNGDLRSHNAQLTARIAELCPPEIIKARRDAYMHGSGFFRVTSLGRHKYAAEYLERTRVSVRDE